ncbi:cyclase family protein [Homoserinibacter sp. GY 40078]|uniref:cyclase family protein n=1 Tax=Homoserinibacter sp. GY 40078 TaxID=2603275 RepID=UPI0011C70F09|nr:cyclase family protein [Homoserinibacter sp. GY 40078]TXK19246.1 cyclase family protein [Homoserinibacter sp. GY 40078]
MTRRIPRFGELRFHPGSEERSAWGVFGDDDELGTLNLLSPAARRRGLDAVVDGTTYSLNWDMTLPDPTFFERKPLKHVVIDLGDVHAGTDDRYESYYSQSSTQWDALSHVGTPDGEFYNGRTERDVHDPARLMLSIANAAASGIAGRYVLLDIGRYRESIGRRVDNAARDIITPAELDAALAWQGSKLEEGDILLLRTGWIEWYEGLDSAARTSLAADSRAMRMRTPGLESSRDSAEWIWDHGLAAVASDTPALEASPFTFDDWDGFLHYRLIPLLGLTIGEFFVLGPLAEACAVDRRYDGLLTAAPLTMRGGSGSPGNALALR